MTSNINVNLKSASPVPTKPTVSKPNKRIDMGNAFNLGKNDLGINSPTHRNTHSEEIFATKPIQTTSRANNDILEDLFSSTEANTFEAVPNPDDFNPRAEESTTVSIFLNQKTIEITVLKSVLRSLVTLNRLLLLHQQKHLITSLLTFLQLLPVIPMQLRSPL